ncbi:hypothetical protein WJX72_009258 [[Myrmecia] bisecta]|uniref:Uncharacterized protein n=1 Tax=[Myrmecia] bisecta TaxID=41462 RepID=A0AAW1QG01_9CHLO
MDHEESLRRLREAVGGEFSANSPPVIPAGTMDQEPIGSAIAHLASEFMGLGQADRSPEWQRVVAMRAEGNNSPSSDKAWRDWEVVSPTRCASPRLPTTSDTTAKWSGNFNEAGSAAAEIAPGVQHVDSEQGVIAVVSSPPAPQPSASSSAANTVCSGQEQAAPLAAKAIPADSAAQDISEPIMAASQHDTGPAKPEQLLDVSDAAQPEDQHTLEPQHTLGPPVSSSPVPAFPALDSLRSTAGSGVMVGDFEASDEDAVELLHADLEGPDGGSEVEAPPVAAPPVNDAPASGPAPPAARPPAYGRLPSLVVEQVLAGLRVPLDKVSSSEMVQRFWSWLQEWTGRLQAVLPTRPILHLYHLAPMKGQPQRIDWVKAGLATSVVALGALVGYLALRQRDLTRALRLKDKEISQMVFRMFSLQEALQGSRRIPIIRHTCSFTSFNAADLI